MNNILNNYYAAILFLALIFFIISKYNSSVLIALIIIIIFYYHIDNNIKQANATKKNREEDIVDNIDKGIDTIKELNTNNFNININAGIYIYILSDRYDIYIYIPIFNDIVNDILEILYSFVFVVPNRFKHIYGFNPSEEIDKSIVDFRTKLEKMLIVLNNYGKIEKKKIYIDIYKYNPYEKNKELYLP